MESSSSIYLYYSASGVLVYVGVTDRGVRRLHEHADSKPWWSLVTGCAIEHFASRAEALARERYLIGAYRPAFNYQHNPDRGLSDAEKLAKCGAPVLLPITLPASGVYGPMTVEDRRKFHEDLTREQKLIYPCIVCGERPGHQGRPMCMPCIATKKRRGQDEARRRIALGEMRRAAELEELACRPVSTP